MPETKLSSRVSDILTLLGVILIAGALFAVFFFTEAEWVGGWFGARAKFPYERYAAPLFISGLILLVVGRWIIPRARVKHSF